MQYLEMLRKEGGLTKIEEIDQVTNTVDVTKSLCFTNFVEKILEFSLNLYIILACILS